MSYSCDICGESYTILEHKKIRNKIPLARSYLTCPHHTDEERAKYHRKKAFLEAAEMVEDLYVTCHMPITEIARHLKLSE